MNGTAVKPLYLIRSGSGFVFMLSTLEMTPDPVDAIALPLDEALRCARRLRERGLVADVVLAGQAIRAHQAFTAAFWLILLVLALAALFFAARAAIAGYRVVIADPVMVCSVPDGGITLDLPHFSASIGGHCVSDKIFADGFNGVAGGPR